MLDHIATIPVFNTIPVFHCSHSTESRHPLLHPISKATTEYISQGVVSYQSGDRTSFGTIGPLLARTSFCMTGHLACREGRTPPKGAPSRSIPSEGFLISPWRWESLVSSPTLPLHESGNEATETQLPLTRVAKLCPVDFFIPRGQFGVGVKGGLEAVIHCTRHAINEFKDEENMYLLKLNFLNAFNECLRQCFLGMVEVHFPELLE